MKKVGQMESVKTFDVVFQEKLVPFVALTRFLLFLLDLCLLRKCILVRDKEAAATKPDFAITLKIRAWQ